MLSQMRCSFERCQVTHLVEYGTPFSVLLSAPSNATSSTTVECSLGNAALKCYIESSPVKCLHQIKSNIECPFGYAGQYPLATPLCAPRMCLPSVLWHAPSRVSCQVFHHASHRVPRQVPHWMAHRMLSQGILGRCRPRKRRQLTLLGSMVQEGWHFVPSALES